MSQADDCADAMSKLSLHHGAAAPAVVFGCGPAPPIPRAGLRYTDMTAEQKRAAVIAIVTGHPDLWGAWESSCVRVLHPV
jgi:hypothetical protein